MKIQLSQFSFVNFFSSQPCRMQSIWRGRDAQALTSWHTAISSMMVSLIHGAMNIPGSVRTCSRISCSKLLGSSGRRRYVRSKCINFTKPENWLDAKRQHVTVTASRQVPVAWRWSLPWIETCCYVCSVISMQSHRIQHECHMCRW